MAERYSIPRFDQSDEYKSLMDEIAALKAKDVKARADYRAIVDPLYSEIDSLMARIGEPWEDRSAKFRDEAIRELDDLVRQSPHYKNTVLEIEKLRSLVPNLEQFLKNANPNTQIELPRFLTQIPLDPISYKESSRPFLEEQLANAKKSLADKQQSISGPLTSWYPGNMSKAILGPQSPYGLGGVYSNDIIAEKVIENVVDQKIQDQNTTFKNRIAELEDVIIPSYRPIVNAAVNNIDSQINALYNSIPQRTRDFEARYLAEKRDVPVEEVLKNPVAYKEADYLNEVLDKPFNEALNENYDSFLARKTEADAKAAQLEADRAAQAKMREENAAANQQYFDNLVKPGVPVKAETSVLPGMAANPGPLAPLSFEQLKRQFAETGQLGRPFYYMDDPAAANIPIEELTQMFFGDKANQVNLTRAPQTATPVVSKEIADRVAKEIALGGNLGNLTFQGKPVDNQIDFLSNYIQNAGVDAVIKDLSDKGVKFGAGYNAPLVDPAIAREVAKKAISTLGFDPEKDPNVGNYSNFIQTLGIEKGLEELFKNANKDIKDVVRDTDTGIGGLGGSFLRVADGKLFISQSSLDDLNKRNEEALAKYQTGQQDLFNQNLQNILAGQDIRPSLIPTETTKLPPNEAVRQVFEQYGLDPSGSSYAGWVDYFTKFGNDVGVSKFSEFFAPVARGQTATLFEPIKPFTTDVYSSFGTRPTDQGTAAPGGQYTSGQYTPGQFIPGSFQQQIGAPTGPVGPLPPSAPSRPLITEAERPSLDAAIQYIESTRPGAGPMPYMTSEQVGGTPTAPASYADLFGYTPYTEYMGRSEYTTPMNSNLYAAGYEANIPPQATMREGGSVADARGLAALGRNGDTMLVHMTPEEVSGLRAIAMREGTDLTINPETGLPEANRLKRAFKKFGPMIIGALAAPYLGPLAGTLGLSTAATSGLLVGAGTMLGGGSFKQGLMQGLGTYGAAGLAQGLGYQGMGGAPGQTAVAAPGAGPSGVTSTAGPSVGAESGAVDAGRVSGGYGPQPAAQAATLTPPPAVAPVATGAPTAPTGATPAKPPSFGQKFTDVTGVSPSTALIGGTMLAGLSEGEKERDMYEEERRRQAEEEERRKRLGMESFARANEPVNTRTLYGASGGLVALARGGMTYMEAGGTTGPTGEPRMVAGNGDGMSDSVPATIEGVQEARLANDEFVIPADVVADIGNGSSSSGAKKLYDMMDRIRQARHGTAEQPPEINAEQYMPA